MRYILVLFLLFYTLQAKKFKQKVENSNSFIKAKTYYKIGEYEKSYLAFKKLFFKNLDNININYYLALNEIKLKKYLLAQASLERILIRRPNNFDALFLLGKLFYETNNDKLAFNILNNIKQYPKEKDKKEIEKYLTKLLKRQKTFFINGSFLLGSDRTTNANNGLIEQYTFDNFLPNVKFGELQKSDTYFTYLLDLNLTKIFPKNNNIAYKTNIVYLNKLYSSEEEQDFEFYGIKPEFFYFTKESVFSLALKHQRFQAGQQNTANYFDALGFDLNYIHKNHNFKISTQRYFYRDTNQRHKNYTSYNFYYDLYKLGNVDLGFNFKRDLAFKSDRTNLNKIRLGTYVAYNQHLTNTLKTKYKVNFYNTRYNDRTILFNSKRDDRRLDYSISLQKIYEKHNNFILDLSYVKNNSNQKAYDYDSKNLGLRYIRTFKIK